MKRHDTQSGFSLVELAITLTVIGLLLGGLLKANELLENGRVSTIVTQAGHYQSAIAGFKNMYGALPGDITDPSRINGCPSVAYCNASGNGDGMIYVSDASDFAGGVTTGESRRVWIQLAKAGLINTVDATNDNSVQIKGGVDYPATPFEGGMYDVHFSRNATGSVPLSTRTHYLKTRPPAMSDAADNLLTYQQAQKVDLKMDDGYPTTGAVLGRRANGANCGSGNFYRFANNNRHLKCDVWIEMNF